jgi:hypothetical protein
MPCGAESHAPLNGSPPALQCAEITVCASLVLPCRQTALAARIDVRSSTSSHTGGCGACSPGRCDRVQTDKVFIIGSQSILLAWPEAPPLMRTSPEIDAYPENAKDWENEERKKHPGENPEASEQINALFGSGSQFHRTHGFYIDGVDRHTARLPDGWEARAVTRQVRFGRRIVTAIAPCPDDLIVSKLARLDDKDKAFIEAYYAERPLDVALMEERIGLSHLEPPVAQRACNYIRTLSEKIQNSRRPV